MLGKALYLFFFWRRNDWRSIAFKTAVWGSVAWLLVGLVTTFDQGLYAAAAIALLSGGKYSLVNHFETQRLLALVDGDREQLKFLKTRMYRRGIAGAMMGEMLRNEIHQDDFDLQDAAPLTPEKRAANLTETRRVLDHVTNTCLHAGFMTQERYSQSRTRLLEEYGDGHHPLSLDVALEECLPERVLSFAADGHSEEDDHAALVRAFAAATGGSWQLDECTSRYEAETDRWTVELVEAGDITKSWRFAQEADLLSEVFLEQLVRYTELRTEHAVTVLDSEDVITVACLPMALHRALHEAGDEESYEQLAA